jgi:hypothetical protein
VRVSVCVCVCMCMCVCEGMCVCVKVPRFGEVEGSVGVNSLGRPAINRLIPPGAQAG